MTTPDKIWIDAHNIVTTIRVVGSDTEYTRTNLAQAAVAAAYEAAAQVADGLCKGYPEKIKACRKRGDTVGEGLYESALYDCKAISEAIRALILPTEAKPK